MEAKKERLQEFIDSLAEISEPCESGVQRQSYSDAYKQGAAYVKGTMEAAGLQVYEDPVGNLFGLLKGTDETKPTILSGSHLDTVRCAGAYDGIAGVACALEVARMIKESGKPLAHSYCVLGTVGEEGTRFGQVLIGSQYLTGIFGEEKLDQLVGKEDGKTLRQALEEYGAVGNVKDCSIKNRPINAVLELHGEQGPVLEQENIQLGIVDSIAGIIWMEATITGQTNHSGTVPMSQRKDAGIGAYEMILDLNRYVTDHYDGKATLTVGQLELQPGSSNCIPGKATFSLDVRSGNQGILDDIKKHIEEWKERLQACSLSLSLQVLSQREPVTMDSSLRAVLEEVCSELCYSHKHIDSGAGHDAMVFAKAFPTAMLFLPNRDGISHNPEEYISPESLAEGANVLYETLRRLDQR